MTISKHRRLRISIAMIGLFLAGAEYADQALAQTSTCNAPSGCVTLTLNANLQVTKLHPAVTHVFVRCLQEFAVIPEGVSSHKPVVNRGYTGSAIGIINVPRAFLETPSSRTMNLYCSLWLSKSGVDRAAVASAAQPENISNDNWHIVATGSTITWNQAVTFPSAP